MALLAPVELDDLARRRTGRGPCPGVQISTCSTRSSAAADAAAAAPRASSASYSTMANTVKPTAASASSTRGNCDQQLGLDAGAVLVAVAEVVAERLDDVVGGHADVGGAVLEQLQHACPATPRVAATSCPSSVTWDGHGEVVAEQLVGAVDQVDLQCHPPHRRTPTVPDEARLVPIPSGLHCDTWLRSGRCSAPSGCRGRPVTCSMPPSEASGESRNTLADRLLGEAMRNDPLIRSSGSAPGRPAGGSPCWWVPGSWSGRSSPR